MRLSYSEKLRDPRWKSRRLQIIERDEGACRWCGNTERLEVHHRFYTRGAEPWEYDDSVLVTLCHGCHEWETFQREEVEARLLHWFKQTGFLAQHLDDLAKELEFDKSTARGCIDDGDTFAAALDALISRYREQRIQIERDRAQRRGVVLRIVR